MCSDAARKGIEMITDETWFLRFEGRAGERKSATLQTTNGEALADV